MKFIMYDLPKEACNKLEEADVEFTYEFDGVYGTEEDTEDPNFTIVIDTYKEFKKAEAIIGTKR